VHAEHLDLQSAWFFVAFPEFDLPATRKVGKCTAGTS